MNRLTSISLVTLTLLPVGNVGALNLSPLRMVVASDGPPQERYYFQDDDKRLGFRIDRKMTVTGSADQAVFHLTDIGTASVRLFKSPAPAGTPLDKDMTSYQSVARSMLPSDSANLTLTESKPGAISINGWKSVQFNYTYNALGHAYRRSITFLNFAEGRQYVFDVNATAADFEKVYARGYNVLNSLYEVPVKETNSPS